MGKTYSVLFDCKTKLFSTVYLRRNRWFKQKDCQRVNEFHSKDTTQETSNRVRDTWGLGRVYFIIMKM